MRRATYYRVRGTWELIAPGLRALELGTHACGDGTLRGTLLESFAEGQTALVFLPGRSLREIAEAHAMDVCEDGDPPCGDADCERKHSEAAGGGAPAAYSACSASMGGATPSAAPADPEPYTLAELEGARAQEIPLPAPAPTDPELRPGQVCMEPGCAAAATFTLRGMAWCPNHGPDALELRGLPAPPMARATLPPTPVPVGVTICDLPARGSAELHAELAPPPGAQSRIGAALGFDPLPAMRQPGRTIAVVSGRGDQGPEGPAWQVEIRRTADDSAAVIHRGRLICRLFATPKVSEQSAQLDMVRADDGEWIAPAIDTPPGAAERISRALGEPRTTLVDFLAWVDGGRSLAELERVVDAYLETPRADRPAIDTRTAELVAQIADQDRQIAELSERLARQDLQRETLLAALGRAAEDLTEHAGAWTGLRTVEGGGALGWRVMRGWAEHAERSAQRVLATVASAGEGSGDDS